MSWFSKKNKPVKIVETEQNFDFSESEKEKISALIEALPDGFLIFDNQNRISMINLQAQMFLNISSSEVIGKNILDLSRYELCKPIVTLLGGGISDALRQEVMLRPDLIAEVSAMPFLINQNKAGSIVSLHNITQQKEIEKLKSEFITIAAHQLRTPTSIIKWTSQGLLNGESGELAPEQKQAMEKLSQTNERIINLVNNLLNVIEAEGGKQAVKLNLQDIEEIVILAVKDFDNFARIKNIKIFLQKPKSGLPEIMVDPEKIRIAISAFIDNALKYNTSGGRVVISLSKTNGDVKISIKDSGSGISERDKQKLFTKFFRGQDAMKIDTEGRGLGLFIARNIIESYGGRLDFNSKLGEGSEFYFTLPIKEKFGEYVTGEFY